MNERGWVALTAVLVMSVMLMLGLAVFSYADGQQGQSAAERTRESTFQLAEGALKSQAAFLAYRWPGSAASAYPASCTQSSTDAACPDPASITAGLGGADFGAGTYSWSTEVHDNGAPNGSYYSDTTTRAQPAYDANADGGVWLRSEAVVRGRRRIVVAVAKSEPILETFPKNAVTAGHFGTTNSGKKLIVDTRGNSAEPAAIAVRCNTGPPSQCMNYQPTKGQVFPDIRLLGYSSQPALGAESLARLKATAQAAGTYWASGCPAALPATFALYYVENGNCQYSGGTYNSATSPGVLVVATGTLTLTGNAVFHGLIYAANLQNAVYYTPVVSLNGTATVYGAVTVDGEGGFYAGSSRLNLVYDRNVFNGVLANGSVALVQNTWRELPTS